MFGLADSLKLLIELIQKSQDTHYKHTIIKYAIIAEAKINNDLATLIYRAGVKNTIKNHPKVFMEFSTSTSDILLATGTPAKCIFEDIETPSEEAKREMGKKYPAWIAEKSCSELYEFYIRKCITIKKLAHSDGLTIPKTDIAKRCSNIKKATLCLISHLT